MPQPRLILRTGREQRQLQGHPWVYEGEIARVKGTPRDGGVADCYSHDDVFLGRGYFNSRFQDSPAGAHPSHFRGR